MSSFEPLFGGSGRARLTPRATASVPSVEVWMPIIVDTHSDRHAVPFDTDFGDNAASSAAAKEAESAAALARIHAAECDAAYLRGTEDGRTTGESAERTRLRGALIAAESAFDELRAGESRWLANVEENVAAIAIAVAHQVVMREVATAPEIVLALATRAVQEFGLDQPLSIRVNPTDLENMHGADRTGADDYRNITAQRDVRWVGDARLESGGCVVEGRERIVDGRIDTSLERLYRRLTHTNA
jgi:flagellar assembly protein FliH